MGSKKYKLTLPRFSDAVGVFDLVVASLRPLWSVCWEWALNLGFDRFELTLRLAALTFAGCLLMLADIDDGRGNGYHSQNDRAVRRRRVRTLMASFESMPRYCSGGHGGRIMLGVRCWEGGIDIDPAGGAACFECSMGL